MNLLFLSTKWINLEQKEMERVQGKERQGYRKRERARKRGNSQIVRGQGVV